MKKQLILSAMLLASAGAMACTNFIVGKKASYDGSVICSYSADSYGMFQGLAHYPAGKHPKGTMRQVYDWDTNKYGGEIPEAEETYNVIGNINEWQVTIGETTFGGREEMVDTTGIIDYGSLIYIALQRSKTAREAIDVMTSLVEKYGYNSEGETFTICDPNEAWIMEMMGCASDRKIEKGRTVWVALRIPDDMICGHANQSRITKFNMKDKENVRYSKNVVSYARKMGWFKGKDEDFSYNAAYAAPDFSGRRICDARVWQFFNRYADGMDRYIPWAEGKDANAEAMPLWVKPNKKLTVQDVEAAMRDHFENTPFSLDQDMGGGIWEMPYRPTPLYFKVDGKEYFNERPVSTQQAGFVFVSQMRSWLPRQIGGCFWFANDDGNMVPFTPVYCCTTESPRPYNTPGADDLNFSMDNAFWVQNWVSNMVYPRYSMLFPSLKEVRDSLDNSYFRAQKEVEDKALTLDEAARTKYLTAYTAQKADQMLARWRQLATYLIVKYNDMTIKPEENGQFTRTKYGLGSTVKRPGYSQKYARELVKQTGEKFQKP
ncbi:C69 family dipeptidase [Prevotella sp. E15-22]|jgi:dipeptidase|uniref:dipeptidase n=1 Tax=Prevotella sp. E15-22 TaxID=2937774 RepID=UPI00206F25B7|nr:C69 family dipeptidase [Prevotella sp. E15-22]UPS45597.1 C69 family dipeptidase [Prevotella sp. E15-22]